MTNYTPIAVLPYPAMSDPPNGPEQFLALASALESKVINRYTSAANRNLAIAAPSLGMLTFRDDDRIYEFWNGTAWQGLDRAIALSTSTSASVVGEKVFTTTESAELARVDITITNPSLTSRFMWVASAEFYVGYKWTAAALFASIRHYLKEGTAAIGVARKWSIFTASGTSILYTGDYPIRSGFLGPGASTIISTWITIDKSNTTTGTITLTSGRTELIVWGVTTI